MLGAGDVRVRLSPGVYRGIYTAPSGPSVESAPASPAGVATAACSRSSSGTAAQALDTADVASGLAAARRRFHQMREMRREMSGRPLASAAGDASSAPAAAAAGPGESTPRASVLLAGTPSAVSLGLPLDRLAADDPVTRAVLRTAAAERALRQQQRENDELKRAIVAQRGEAALQQALVDRLSADLAESGRTVLRQTATLKSLASEMERRDAYHLIREKRRGSGDGSTTKDEDHGAAGTRGPPAGEVTQQRVDALIEQVEQLTREKSDLTAQLAARRSSADEARRGSAVEAIDTDDEDGMDATGWVPAARVELHQLVQRLGSLLRGGAASAFGGASRVAAADAVYEVELSGVTCLLPPPPGSGHGSDSASPSTSATVCFCGPYSRDSVLLCVRPDGTAATLLSMHRSCATAAAAELTSRTWCAMHATPQTAGVLCVTLFRDTEARETAAKEGDSAIDSGQPKPSASATIAVRTLIATALSGRCDLRATNASSTVHTVHLLSDHGTAHGSVTFHVRVAEVHPLRYRLGRGTAHLEEVRLSEELDRCRTRAPPCEVSASARAGDAATRRGAVLSPARDDAGTPVRCRRPSTPASRRASAASSPAPDNPRAPSAVGVFESDDAALTVPTRQTSAVAPLPPLPSASPLASAAPPPPLATKRAGEEESRVEACEPAERFAHRRASVGDEVVTSAPALPPLGVVAIPPPPRAAAVPSPPAFFPPPPPPAVVPPPPPPASVPAAPPPSPTGLRVHVKAVRDVGGGGGAGEGEEEGDGGGVGGLLEHCSQLQVVAYVGDECVFTSPARHNPAHSMWSAEESGFTVFVTPGQALCFEVRDGDVALSKATVVVPAAAGAAELVGAQELSLMSVRRNEPSGVLSLSLAKLD